MEYQEVSSFPKYFEFASLCSFICLQAVYQLSGPVCKSTWNYCPSYSASKSFNFLRDRYPTLLPPTVTFYTPK